MYITRQMYEYLKPYAHKNIFVLTLTEMKLSPLSVAIAFAIIVLEHPGGPYINIPLGGVIPRRLNASGCVNGSSIDCFSLSFNSSCPPISVHFTYDFNQT